LWVLLSVEFWFTLKTYLKGAPFYNASANRSFVRKTALEDALLPREIVALAALPHSGFVQRPLSFTTWVGKQREVLGALARSGEVGS